MQRGWRATGGTPWRACALALAVALATSIVGPVWAGDPPTPLLPEAEATLAQDNLFGECTIYGLGWEFAWSDAGAGARYELYVEREGGPSPYWDQVLAAPAVRVARCGCLPDNMLSGWRWRVRAQAPGEDWSAWSDWRAFQVARLLICMRGGQEN
jgi:hypothetical protein